VPSGKNKERNNIINITNIFINTWQNTGISVTTVTSVTTLTTVTAVTTATTLTTVITLTAVTIATSVTTVTSVTAVTTVTTVTTLTITTTLLVLNKIKSALISGNSRPAFFQSIISSHLACKEEYFVYMGRKFFLSFKRT
jgi:hypothetical protein